MAASCTHGAIVYRGVALAPGEKSTRESEIEGELGGARCFEKARIVLDRSFETAGFESSPFVVEKGSHLVLVLESDPSDRASLHVELDAVGPTLTVVEDFIPHFFLDTTVPGVGEPVRYTLVCKGGTGRMRIAREGGEVQGDLAIAVACRTYVGGREVDESEIHLSGPFRGAVR